MAQGNEMEGIVRGWILIEYGWDYDEQPVIWGLFKSLQDAQDAAAQIGETGEAMYPKRTWEFALWEGLQEIESSTLDEKP